jgi:hypothetical protein
MEILTDQHEPDRAEFLDTVLGEGLNESSIEQSNRLDENVEPMETQQQQSDDGEVVEPVQTEQQHFLEEQTYLDPFFHTDEDEAACEPTKSDFGTPNSDDQTEHDSNPSGMLAKRGRFLHTEPQCLGRGIDLDQVEK